MPDPGSTLDQWEADKKDVLEDGTYIIQSALADGLVLDAAGASSRNGANVQLYPVSLTDARKWRVSHDEKGYVTFTNAASGKVLDVYGGKKGSGTNVQQYEANDSRAQKWIVRRDTTGRLCVVSALSSELGLDVKNASAKAKANVQVYMRNGTDAQQFSFYRLVE